MSYFRFGITIVFFSLSPLLFSLRLSIFILIFFVHQFERASAESWCFSMCTKCVCWQKVGKKWFLSAPSAHTRLHLLCIGNQITSFASCDIIFFPSSLPRLFVRNVRFYSYAIECNFFPLCNGQWHWKREKQQRRHKSRRQRKIKCCVQQ